MDHAPGWDFAEPRGEESTEGARERGDCGVETYAGRELMTTVARDIMSELIHSSVVERPRGLTIETV